MKSKSYVLVVGEASTPALGSIEIGARMAGAEVRHHFSAEAALELVARRAPLAVVTVADAPGAHQLATQLRARSTVPGLAAIGLSRAPTNLLFEEAYGAGVDDICPLEGRALGRRLRQVAASRAKARASAPEQEPSSPGKKADRVVVVAHADSTSRLLIARVFLDAGYTVRFARDPDQTRASLEGACALVVTSEIETHERVVLSAQLRRDGFDGPIIVNTPPKQIGALRSALAGIDNVVVHDAFGPPANLLFVTNELCNRPAVEARDSERLLYGCTVSFRSAGRDNGDVGFMYNLSAGGVYVRTLAPPPRGEEVWLEFTPPRSDRLVHLEGTAVWTRGFGNNGFATVPSGFGVQVTGGSERDLVRYARSYQTFLRERSGVKIEHPAPMRRSEAPASLSASP